MEIIIKYEIDGLWLSALKTWNYPVLPRIYEHLYFTTFNHPTKPQCFVVVAVEWGDVDDGIEGSIKPTLVIITQEKWINPNHVASLKFSRLEKYEKRREIPGFLLENLDKMKSSDANEPT